MVKVLHLTEESGLAAGNKIHGDMEVCSTGVKRSEPLHDR